jgi:hypothetical protein
MELHTIVQRYAEGLHAIDSFNFPDRYNTNGALMLPGVMSMTEQDLFDRLDRWWGNTYPNDFSPLGAHNVQVSYPGQRRNKCDQIFTTDGNVNPPEWAIEAKYFRFIGDNGKANDFAVGKALSPFLKDRSLYHDVVRMRENPPARRCAVFAVGFSYDYDTCQKARLLHPGETSRIAEIESVCRKNGGSLLVKPLADIADGILRVRELVIGSYAHSLFEAWAHPCGGRGVVFGWEVLMPDQTNTW